MSLLLVFIFLVLALGIIINFLTYNNLVWMNTNLISILIPKLRTNIPPFFPLFCAIIVISFKHCKHINKVLALYSWLLNTVRPETFWKPKHFTPICICLWKNLQVLIYLWVIDLHHFSSSAWRVLFSASCRRCASHNLQFYLGLITWCG